MKLLIGLTPIVDAGRDSLWMLPGYMQGLEAVGGIGMMLPLTDDAAMLKDLVDRVDGLLLTGGNDVAPVLYGETKETFCGENDPWRDRMEARLIELALQGGQAGVWHLPRAANFKCGAGRYAISGFENPDRAPRSPTVWTSRMTAPCMK